MAVFGSDVDLQNIQEITQRKKIAITYLIPFPSLAAWCQHKSVIGPHITGMGPFFPSIMHVEASPSADLSIPALIHKQVERGKISTILRELPHESY